MKETYELMMNGKTVIVEFTPASSDPTKKIEVGHVMVIVDGQGVQYPYQKTSFIPLPFFK